MDPNDLKEIENRLEKLQQNKEKHRKIQEDLKNKNVPKNIAYEDISKVYEYFSKNSLSILHEGIYLMSFYLCLLIQTQIDAYNYYLI